MRALPSVPSASLVVQGRNDPMQSAGCDSASTSRESEEDMRRAAIVRLSRTRTGLPRLP